MRIRHIEVIADLGDRHSLSWEHNSNAVQNFRIFHERIYITVFAACAQKFFDLADFQVLQNGPDLDKTN